MEYVETAFLLFVTNCPILCYKIALIFIDRFATFAFGN